MARFLSVFSTLFDFIFGYDVFISYSHRDARQYASKLCEVLQKRDYQCFLDARELPPGEKLREGLVRALRRSQTLLLVASQGVFESEQYVWLELDGFQRVRPRGRVVPIDIGEAIDGAPEDSRLAKLIREGNLVWSSESPGNLAEGPSEEVLKSLLVGFDFTRRNTRRLRIVTGAVAVLLLLFVLACLATIQANIARRETQRKAEVLQIRRLSAESAAERERTPRRSLLLAVEAVRMAERDEVRAEALPAAEQALRDTVAHTGGRVLWQAGGPVTVMATGAGGALHRRWLAAGTEDHVVRLWDLANPGKYRDLHGHTGYIRSLAFSPDCRWLVTGADDGTVRRWDLDAPDSPEDPAVLHAQRGGAAMVVAISPDGGTLVTADTGGTEALVWNLRAANSFADCKRVLPHPGGVRTLTFGSNPARLFVGCGDGKLRLWDLKKQEATPLELGGHDGEVTAAAVGSNDRWAITGGRDGLVLLHDMRASRPAVAVLGRHAEWVHAVGISPDGRLAASAGGDGRVFLWNLGSERPRDSVILLAGHGRDAVTALGFSPDSRWLVTAGEDRTARVWDLNNPDPTDAPVLRGHDGPLRAVAISADIEALFTAGRDGSVRQWDSPSRLRNPSPSPQVLEGHDGQVFAVAVDADGRFLATGCEDGETRLWVRSEGDGRAIPRRLVLPDSEARPGASRPVTALAISGDGHWLASGGIGVPTRLWNLTAQPVVPPDRIGMSDAALAFSRDGRLLIAGGEEGITRVVDLESREPAAKIRTLAGRARGIVSLAISDDNRWLAAGSKDGTVRLWDLNGADGEPRMVLAGHGGPAARVAISPQNRWLAAAGPENRIRIVDLSAPGPAATAKELSGHADQVTSLAFSPDGRRLVTGSRDGTSLLWDLSTGAGKVNVRELARHEREVSAVAVSGGTPRAVTAGYDGIAKLHDLTAKDPGANPVVLSGHRSGINAIAVSRDGRFLLTGSYDMQARLWLLKDDDLVDLARKIAGREPTEEEKRTAAGE